MRIAGHCELRRHALAELLPRLGLGLALAAAAVADLGTGWASAAVAATLINAGWLWGCRAWRRSLRGVRRASRDVARHALRRAAELDAARYHRMRRLLQQQGCLYEFQIEALLWPHEDLAARWP